MDKNRRRCEAILLPSPAAIRVGRPRHEAGPILRPARSALDGEEEEEVRGRSARPPRPGLALGMCPPRARRTGRTMAETRHANPRGRWAPPARL